MAKAHEPTDITKQTVKNLSADGVPIHKIGAYMGIGKNTLHKYYQLELDCASVDKIRNVSGALYDNAMKGNVTAQIFFLKCQARWKEDRDGDYTNDEGVDKIQIEVINGKEKVNE